MSGEFMTTIEADIVVESEGIQLDSSYKHCAILSRPKVMGFRGTENGRTNWKYLTFKDAIRQPIEVLAPDPTERNEQLEHVLWHKVRAEFPGQYDMAEFKAAFAAEFLQRFGEPSQWASQP
jgi:hypothetical protein